MDAETAPLLTPKFSRQSEYERDKDKGCFLSYNLRKYFYFTLGILVGGVIVITIGICIHFTLKHCKRRRVTSSVSSNVLLTAHTDRNESTLTLPHDIAVHESNLNDVAVHESSPNDVAVQESNSYLEPTPLEPKCRSLPPTLAPPEIPQTGQISSSEPVRLPTKKPTPKKKPFWNRDQSPMPEIPPPLTPERISSLSKNRQGSPDPWKTSDWLQSCSPAQDDDESWFDDEDVRDFSEDAQYLLTLYGNAVHFRRKSVG